ncbi:glycosyltransferase family 2 protein [Roseovarius sp.]|uniref:glycosyltransferase family 2 protein n=1 Tax=Roseovarius sp. TaxID=1486281 RepID=UPI0026110B4F|nr:glycosyltransferase family 2 protein [Roseovarius sp.]
MVKYKTDILLATYNGSAYLPELLASLDAQSNQNWRLIARDDGSTDSTVKQLKDWAANLGDRFVLLEDGRKNLGSMLNFGALFDRSDAEYVMPCDQDDFWVPDKIERLTSHMKRLEEKHGEGTPLIVHSDLIVSDVNLEPIADSFWEYQRIRLPPDNEPWKILTIQNAVTGCAMIGNRALMDIALPIPDEAMMHDWWLALAAALFGKISVETTPTVQYRQHESNALGARDSSTSGLLCLIASRPSMYYLQAKDAIRRSQSQAGSASERFTNLLTSEQRVFLEDYAHLGNCGFFKRKIFPIRHQLYYKDFVRSAGFLGVL